MTAINANETINTLNPATLQEIINMSVTTALKQVNSKAPLKGEALTLNAFFYGDFQQTQIENTESQKNTLKAWYRPHIKPLLGDKVLTEITYEDLQGLLSTLDLSYNTLCSYRGMLKHIFSYAFKREYIDKNPATDLKVPRQKQRDHKPKLPATVEQYQLLYEVSKDDWCGIIIPLLFETGMRREEILGLDWSDVKDGYISVNKAYASTKGGNSSPILKEPKTKGSKRQIPISPTLEKALRKHKAMQGGDKDYVVSQQRFNARMSPTGFNRKWKEYKEKAGIRDSITPHSCRHYFASLLLTMGIPVNECMRLTGHDNYKTFMKYAYVEQTTKESMHIFVNTITDKSPIAV